MFCVTIEKGFTKNENKKRGFFCFVSTIENSLRYLIPSFKMTKKKTQIRRGMGQKTPIFSFNGKIWAQNHFSTAAGCAWWVSGVIKRR